MAPTIVAAGVDTLVVSASAEGLPEELVAALDACKHLAQEADEDVATDYTFCGHVFFCKPHGSQRHWRYILHCPNLHLELGLGKKNHLVARARFSAVYLWEVGVDEAISALYALLVDLLGGEHFALHVSELHLCADVVGWEPSLEDANAFITRGHNKTQRLDYDGESEGDDSQERQERQERQETENETGYTLPPLSIHHNGRRCAGFDFSRGAAHACCIYDKTKEISKSGKQWVQEVWLRNGWDGVSRVVRVEFRYKREALHELSVEEPYAMLCQLAGLWAYSTAKWLRHTIPTEDANRGRWPLSPFWQAIQSATFDGDPTPAVRERKRQDDLTHICQMVSGCSSTARAYLAGILPSTDDGSVFLRWFYTWMQDDLWQRHHCTFTDVWQAKVKRLGIVASTAVGEKEGESHA
jgi:hypothetical protein